MMKNIKRLIIPLFVVGLILSAVSILLGTTVSELNPPATRFTSVVVDEGKLYSRNTSTNVVTAFNTTTDVSSAIAAALTTYSNTSQTSSGDQLIRNDWETSKSTYSTVAARTSADQAIRDDYETSVTAYVGGVATGYKLARGVVDVTGTTEVETGLTNVIMSHAGLHQVPSIEGNSVATTSSAGIMTIYVYRPTDVGNATPVQTTTTKAISWIAIGI